MNLIQNVHLGGAICKPSIKTPNSCCAKLASSKRDMSMVPFLSKEKNLSQPYGRIFIRLIKRICIAMFLIIDGSW